MQAATQYAVHNGPRRESPSHTPDSGPKTPISNRYNKLLEFGVTYTKQTTEPISNRYKIRFIFAPLLRRKTRALVFGFALPCGGDLRASGESAQRFFVRRAR